MFSLSIAFILLVVFIWLWRDKRKNIKKGYVTTRFGVFYKSKNPKWFWFSIWVDIMVIGLLFMGALLQTLFLFVSLFNG